MAAGDRWYGTAVLGSSPGPPGTSARSRSRSCGRTTTSPRRRRSSRRSRVTRQLRPHRPAEHHTGGPALHDRRHRSRGLEIDEGSVTGGGVVDGQTITWEVHVPTPSAWSATTSRRHPGRASSAPTGRGSWTSPGLAPAQPPWMATPSPSTPTRPSGRSSSMARSSRSLVVAEDGLVTVSGGYGGEPWVPQDAPRRRRPQRRLRPVVVRPGGGRGRRPRDSAGPDHRGWRRGHPVGGPVRVHRRPPGEPTVGPSVGTFQAWIYNTVEDFRPEMTFEYGDLGALPSVATIGVERILGDRATSLVNAADPSTVLTEGGRSASTTTARPSTRSR